ncbi:hypothetical protein DY000_02062410 [Brassica cretica]|uniref:Zinc finger GRF-type domain-containing protein n=1 Tax=Brassica cretica TaxID=69181 RepID=A0ABQ7AYK7_BRACR|nr:hypothetical protein DY000_02062410 [Brassica cretica]
MSSEVYYRSWMDKPHLDPNTNLLTEEYVQGIGEFMRLVQQQPDAKSDAQQGIPKLCPCGSITKEVVDEEETYDYLPGKRYFICKDYENDGLHFRQPWVMGMQQEVERLKVRFHEQKKLLRECESLKVRMLLTRVAELEKRNLPVSNSG